LRRHDRGLGILRRAIGNARENRAIGWIDDVKLLFIGGGDPLAANKSFIAHKF
jgi:hypothetical protein